jgi:hypothetical protein
MHTDFSYGLPGLPLRPALPSRPHDAQAAPLDADARSFDELDGDARQAEWSGRPLGRHGRALHAEIETYLQFFAIARADEPQPSAA